MFTFPFSCCPSPSLFGHFSGTQIISHRLTEAQSSEAHDHVRCQRQAQILFHHTSVVRASRSGQEKAIPGSPGAVLSLPEQWCMCVCSCPAPGSSQDLPNHLRQKLNKQFNFFMKLPWEINSVSCWIVGENNLKLATLDLNILCRRDFFFIVRTSEMKLLTPWEVFVKLDCFSLAPNHKIKVCWVELE